VHLHHIASLEELLIPLRVEIREALFPLCILLIEVIKHHLGLMIHGSLASLKMSDVVM
jgi:hypothetical protein